MRSIVCNSWQSHTELLTYYILLITSQSLKDVFEVRVKR